MTYWNSTSRRFTWLNWPSVRWYNLRLELRGYLVLVLDCQSCQMRRFQWDILLIKLPNLTQISSFVPSGKKLSPQNILMSLIFEYGGLSRKKTQIAVKQYHQEAQNEKEDRLKKSYEQRSWKTISRFSNECFVFISIPCSELYLQPVSPLKQKEKT